MWCLGQEWTRLSSDPYFPLTLAYFYCYNHSNNDLVGLFDVFFSSAYSEIT